MEITYLVIFDVWYFDALFLVFFFVPCLFAFLTVSTAIIKVEVAEHLPLSYDLLKCVASKNQDQLSNNYFLLA